jgi:hypothetical protein
MTEEVTKVLEANERGRPYRAAFYSLQSFGGVILMIDPTRQLGHAGLVRWVWGGFMVVGTIISLVGVILDRWREEWSGLPLQVGALGGLIFVLIAGGGSTARLAFACFLAAPIAVIVHRFVALFQLSKASKKINTWGER